MNYTECYIEFCRQKLKIYITYEYTDIFPQITNEDKEQFDDFMCYIPEQFDSSKVMQYYYADDTWLYLGNTSLYDYNN